MCCVTSGELLPSSGSLFPYLRIERVETDILLGSLSALKIFDPQCPVVLSDICEGPPLPCSPTDSLPLRGSLIDFLMSYLLKKEVLTGEGRKKALGDPPSPPRLLLVPL